MITEVEEYFAKGCGRCARFGTRECATKLWAEGLAGLRALCLEAELEEQVKWGHPCYVHSGRNIVLIGAFRGDFRLTFFNAALLSDPAGILEKRGPNTREADMIRFAASEQVEARAGVIRDYLREAMGHAEAGRKAPRKPAETEMPGELLAAMEDDPELARAFAALTPGRQRSYALNLAAAKKPQTRVARIAKFRPAILAGKGANER